VVAEAQGGGGEVKGEGTKARRHEGEEGELLIFSGVAGQKVTKGYTFEIQNLTLLHFVYRNLVSVNLDFCAEN
jgi:hypothetical protein